MVWYIRAIVIFTAGVSPVSSFKMDAVDVSKTLLPVKIRAVTCPKSNHDSAMKTIGGTVACR